MFLELDADRLVQSAALLERRIGERFPGSGLQQVAGALRQLATRTAERTRSIRRRNWWLAGLAWFLIGSGAAVLATLAVELRFQGFAGVSEFVSFLDAALSSAVFLGGTAVFLLSLEARGKRRRALDALHELRALAHIVDMHQLTKDPERMLGGLPLTESSPRRTMKPYELHRYLDYCTEMLAQIAKIGALYVQGFPDRVALEAVDQVENLATGLSRKIWQKIVILDRYADRREMPLPGPRTEGGPSA